MSKYLFIIYNLHELYVNKIICLVVFRSCDNWYKINWCVNVYHNHTDKRINHLNHMIWQIFHLFVCKREILKYDRGAATNHTVIISKRCKKPYSVIWKYMSIPLNGLLQCWRGLALESVVPILIHTGVHF